jgi:hypothetical protein
MHPFRAVLFLAALVAIPSRLMASPIVINFDTLNDGDAVTTQFAGLTFTNATVLVAGISVNELDFPPHSGSNVVFDNGGPISVAFATPVEAFGGYFNYAQPLTLQAFDSAQNLLGSISSAFTSDLGTSGDPGSSPNEFLQLASASGISDVVITANPAGTSFTLDDATITPGSTPTPVPEPATLSLILVGLLGALPAIRARRTHLTTNYSAPSLTNPH